MGKRPSPEALRNYLNSLSTADQRAYAARCGTTVGYLRKALSVGQPLSEKLVIALDRESSARVRVEELRPDVDWAYIATRKPPPTAQGRSKRS